MDEQSKIEMLTQMMRRKHGNEVTNLSLGLETKLGIWCTFQINGITASELVTWMQIAFFV